MRQSGNNYSPGDLFGSWTVIFDGAMGTELLRQSGNRLPCEELNLLHPDIVERTHCAYLQAGADVIRTNSFGANRLALKRYGLEHQTASINRTAVAIARQAVDRANTGRPAFIAGSIGPNPLSVTEMPDTGHSSEDAYAEQALALIEAGADMLICETFQRLKDVGQVLRAVMPLTRRADRRIPVAVCLTPPADSEQAADLAASIFEAEIRSSGIDFYGFNCGTGPESIAKAIMITKPHVSLPMVALPSAGIPVVEGKSLHYPVGVGEFVTVLKDLVDRGFVAAVGGCCGTTPAHIAALAKGLRGPKSN